MYVRHASYWKLFQQNLKHKRRQLMCTCPRVISVNTFPCHKNLIGMVENYLVVNHNCEMTTCKITKAAYEHNAVYDTEDENGEITEYFFVLFGEPMALPKGYTEEELQALFHKPKGEVKEDLESNDNDHFFDDYETLKPQEICPICNNTGTAMVSSEAVPCELCLRSGREY